MNAQFDKSWSVITHEWTQERQGRSLPVWPLPSVFWRRYGPTYCDVRGGAAVLDVLLLNDMAWQTNRLPSFRAMLHKRQLMSLTFRVNEFPCRKRFICCSTCFALDCCKSAGVTSMSLKKPSLAQANKMIIYFGNADKSWKCCQPWSSPILRENA